jgi:hypothetical protein
MVDSWSFGPPPTYWPQKSAKNAEGTTAHCTDFHRISSLRLFHLFAAISFGFREFGFLSSFDIRHSDFIRNSLLPSLPSVKDSAVFLTEGSKASEGSENKLTHGCTRMEK